MPLFNFRCEDHGEFEVLRNSIPKDQHHACPVCDVPAPFVWPLTVMRGDTLPTERHIPGRGYIDSRSKLAKVMKEQHHTPVGDRTDAEGMRAMARKAAAERDAGYEKVFREGMREAAAKRGLVDPFGNLKPEAHEVLSDTPLVSTDDDRVKS